MHQKKLITAGKQLSVTSKVLIMLHGRGANAQDILSLSAYLNVDDFSLIAPQATNNTWYPYSFLAPPVENEPWLSSALDVIRQTVDDLYEKGIHAENIYFLGFSQGACLTLEFVTRNARRYGGVIAFTGGLIGDKIYPESYTGDFDQTPIFIGTSDPDPHVPVQRVDATTNLLKTKNANVTQKVYAGMGHTVNQDEIGHANTILANRSVMAS